MQTSAQMTVRPPSMTCCVPWSWERRETLLPVSVTTYSGLEALEEAAGGIVKVDLAMSETRGTVAEHGGGTLGDQKSNAGSRRAARYSTVWLEN